ncbi:MAG: SOS response-associated peptidase [Desulfonatronovibrio sp.]
MCGRFALYESPEIIKDHFGLDSIPDLPQNYNIAPGTHIVGVSYYEHSLSLMLFKWGFIPHWSKDKKTGYKMINARMESVWGKHSFRSAIRYRRCLIPASGFYEWKKTEDSKQPYFITVADSSIFAMAGIWETWEDKSSGEIIDSCAILTTEAKGIVKDIHDRMPVIIDREGYQEWLDQMIQSRDKLNIKQVSEDNLEAWPVSSRVNSPKNNSEELIQELK